MSRNLENLFAEDERPREELTRLFILMELFADLPLPPDPSGLYPQYGALKEKYLQSLESAAAEAAEEAFLDLYCHIHGHAAPYTSAERKRVDETGGYWCHAGGISPLIKAAPWIGPDTVSADFGAGNGLQGLLLQKLYPHKTTVQIEISTQMIESGRRLQSWLGIPEGRVEWVADDVMNVSPARMDFVYLYRPVKPMGLGEAFYRGFAKAAAEAGRPRVIFSIADCLRDYLPNCYDIFYFDGHLTCYKIYGMEDRRRSAMLRRRE